MAAITNYKDFLLDLDKFKNKTIYIRITALTIDENPIETIEGRATGGSINIDGASSVRRTCSLTMVAQGVNYHDYYWGLNTKFKLEIGVKNVINNLYPDIIWFEQGIFILTSFNTSRTINSFTISLSGKDKMVLLNGEVSGSLESPIDFGQISEEKNGFWIIRKIPIPEIIKNAVHVYGGEPFHNIIIKDLDTYGVELLEYRYEIPMYLYRGFDGEYPKSIFDNAILENDDKQWYLEIGGDPISLKDIPNTHLDQLVDTLTGTANPLPVYSKVNDEYIPYIMAKINYGQTAGYRSTDLIYPGDLIGNIGESLTSILDKIKNMLVEFEYFYNIKGQFVFQKKQSFISTMWSPLEQNESVYMTDALAIASSYAYEFFGEELTISFNNNPNILNLRNDFSIWGERTGITGAKIPVHMRYAIDKKPIKYTQIKIEEGDIAINEYNEKYNTSLSYQPHPQEFNVINQNIDWREIIYQMALDYFKYNHLDDFELRVAQANPDVYPDGRTGYENYYTDLQGFWRQLYNPNPSEDELINYYTEENHPHRYWNKDVYESPEKLNFWFDFLESFGEMGKFGVQSIGSRSKSINDSNIKSIYFRETPNIIFAEKIDNSTTLPGYRYIQIPSVHIESMFSISAQGKSAKNKLDELLYQHSYCIESANITTIPIYYLQPNSRIYLNNEETKLNGDYIVNKLTIPLTYNGTMNLTVTKAAENIL